MPGENASDVIDLLWKKFGTILEKRTRREQTPSSVEQVHQPPKQDPDGDR